ncbi:MAG: GGDEF-domain containing protein [Proteobacteria bacterium]|nr:MAG: GGDEF-domain containing protein [Pseudomonadota bacterium]
MSNNWLKSGSMRAPCISILLLCEEHTDYLWIKSVLETQDDFNVAVHWCATPDDVERCFEQHQYQIIFLDSAFAVQDSLTFLNYLTVISDHIPIISFGANDENACLQSTFRAGGADYLCKQSLSGWAIEKAVRFALFRHESEKQLTARTSIDSLTGVVNRKLFFDRLNQCLHRAERNKELVGILILNIDDFQCINENFGYKAGDELIRSVATRIKQVLRKPDSVARLSGDEFSIVLESLDSFYSCIRVADKLIDVLQAPFTIEQDSIKMTASIGIACFPETGKNAEDLVKCANRAMLNAKDEHGNSYQYYNKKMNSKLSHNLQMEADFRKAIRNGELRLFYQPRIDIFNNELVGMESLVRWQHPSRGLLTPDHFIELAERTGMIVPMGYWVIDQASRDLAQMQAMGYLDLICSVNLSFRQFLDRKLSETIFRIIFNAGVNPSSIELELTESTMMKDLDATQRCLAEISQLGIAFALDDFGTGFSSFSYLHKLPISTLKIDKSFIDDLESPFDSQNIVKAVINLAHNLQMNVVAEGVENESQLRFLQKNYCDQVQGFYFGHPVPYDQFLPVLRKFYPATKLSSL